jgi:agmatinase
MGATPVFLGASTAPDPRAILIGAPLDLTESFKFGTQAAPTRIRAVSDVLETYSPLLGRDLGDVPFADWGDVPCDTTMEAALQAIAHRVGEAASKAFPIMLGGEHTASLGAIRAVQNLYPELAVIQLDAHLDLRDSYDGEALSHATVMRRVADEIGLDRIVQLGVRSGTREEFVLARSCLASRLDLRLPESARDALAERPIYVTIDIDVLDPAAAPGTGCPEPGGASFTEVQALVHSLGSLRVVAADVMEVLPAADVNDVTSVAAAKLVRELILLFAHSR